MAYWRETKSKKTGATISRNLIYTAKDRATQAARRNDKHGLPAWRHDGQNRRESWSDGAIPDPASLKSYYDQLILDLAAYRIRYFANLRVKHFHTIPQACIHAGERVIWNYSCDLSLDQWAIDNTLSRIRWCKRIARKYRVFDLAD